MLLNAVAKERVWFWLVVERKRKMWIKNAQGKEKKE